MDFSEFFISDPKILGGQTVLKGTRIPLRTILASLAEGESFADLRHSFPTLTAEHLQAAVAFAAASALEDQPLRATPNVQ